MLATLLLGVCTYSCLVMFLEPHVNRFSDASCASIGRIRVLFFCQVLETLKDPAPGASEAPADATHEVCEVF